MNQHDRTQKLIDRINQLTQEIEALKAPQADDGPDFLSLALEKLDTCARDGRAALIVPDEAAAVLDYIRKHGISAEWVMQQPIMNRGKRKVRP